MHLKDVLPNEYKRLYGENGLPPRDPDKNHGRTNTTKFPLGDECYYEVALFPGFTDQKVDCVKLDVVSYLTWWQSEVLAEDAPLRSIQKTQVDKDNDKTYVYIDLWIHTPGSTFMAVVFDDGKELRTTLVRNIPVETYFEPCPPYSNMFPHYTHRRQWINQTHKKRDYGKQDPDHEVDHRTVVRYEFPCEEEGLWKQWFADSHVTNATGSILASSSIFEKLKEPLADSLKTRMSVNYDSMADMMAKGEFKEKPKRNVTSKGLKRNAPSSNDATHAAVEVEMSEEMSAKMARFFSHSPVIVEVQAEPAPSSNDATHAAVEVEMSEEMSANMARFFSQSPVVVEVQAEPAPSSNDATHAAVEVEMSEEMSANMARFFSQSPVVVEVQAEPAPSTSSHTSAAPLSEYENLRLANKEEVTDTEGIERERPARKAPVAPAVNVRSSNANSEIEKRKKDYKESMANLYNTLEWSADKLNLDLTYITGTFPEDVTMESFPQSLQDALSEHFKARAWNPDGSVAFYANNYRAGGRKAAETKVMLCRKQWKSMDLDICSSHDKRICAMASVASTVDSRLLSKESMHSWMHFMLATGYEGEDIEEEKKRRALKWIREHQEMKPGLGDPELTELQTHRRSKGERASSASSSSADLSISRVTNCMDDEDVDEKDFDGFGPVSTGSVSTYDATANYHEATAMARAFVMNP